MDNGKIIFLTGLQSDLGPRVLANELAEHLTSENTHVLLIDIGVSPNANDSDYSQNLPLWISRFRGLSPLLLRNSLASSADPFTKLSWPDIPTGSQLNEFMILIKHAFDWILVETSITDTTEWTTLLDISDLLLWVSEPTPEILDRWKDFLQHLTDIHLPQRFARPILFNAPVDWLKKYFQLLEILNPIDVLPEKDEMGLKKNAALRRLAKHLKDDPALFRVRDQSFSPNTDQQQVIDNIKSQVQPQLLEAFDSSRTDSLSRPVEKALAQKAIETILATETKVGGSREERGEIVTRVLEEVLALGPLEALLKDPSISEIMVINKETVYVEKNGKLSLTQMHFSSDVQLRTIIDRIVTPIGRRVDESSPLCDARLPDGSRVNIILPPLALDGPCLTIRKFPARKLDLDDLVRFQSMSVEMAESLRKSVLSHKNIVVSGGTGSGKTTLFLNALSSTIPEDERIVTIEDAAELKLQKPHVIRLESRPPNAEGQGAISIRRLVINALRMRPDRIVVGECRGGEALDMLQAMNTGHDGSLTTVHANSPRDALGRLETLALMAGMDLPVRVVREQIRSAVHLIVQQARLSDGSRKVVSITEVTGMEGDLLVTQELFRYNHGVFEATGIQSAKQGGRFE